jgi:hypothetical protein
MNKVPQYQIDELRANGIVPGATCTSAAFPSAPPFVVPPVENWRMGTSGPMTGEHIDSAGSYCDRYLKYNGMFATVISPAPQQEGLREGDACEPDEHMRKAIIEKAVEMDLTLHVSGNRSEYPCLQMLEGKVSRMVPRNEVSAPRTFIPPGEFYDRLCRMKPAPKPIRIDNREVVFSGGGNIKVGCTAVEWETLEAVYERAKSTR